MSSPPEPPREIDVVRRVGVEAGVDRVLLRGEEEGVLLRTPRDLSGLDDGRVMLRVAARSLMRDRETAEDVCVPSVLVVLRPLLTVFDDRVTPEEDRVERFMVRVLPVRRTAVSR